MINNQPSKPYNDWLAIAKRWDKTVNFGSPISSWTLAMLQEYRIATEENRPPNINNCK